ncbi:hypothetical protein ACHAQA_005462 [Verticillium albo-atrum]
MKDYEAAKSHEIKMEDSFLRCEWQTLSRLPETQSIVFFIKTYMYNVSDVKAEGLGLEFADAIEGLKKGNAPGMWFYKDRFGMFRYLNNLNNDFFFNDVDPLSLGARIIRAKDDVRRTRPF